MNGEEEFAELASGPCVGEQLRGAREAQSMALEDIASTTRIPLRHLRTIEACGYDGLPATTYSAGFIKSWARLLGLNGQALADQFRAEISGATVESTQPLPYEPADPRRTPPAGLALLALLAAVVLVLGYLYWRGTAEQPAIIATAPAPSPAAQSSEPVDAAAPIGQTPAAPVPQARGPVVIGATQDVWIKVSDEGKTLFMNVLHPGDKFQVPDGAVAPLMTTGRPGNTTVMVGETPIPTVGDPDRAAKDVSLRPADLLGRIASAPPAVQPPANAPTPVENSAGT